MKTSTTITKFQCDSCGKECSGNKEISIVDKHYQEFNSYIKLRYFYYCSYATSDGEVCDDCLYKAMKQWIGKYEHLNGIYGT